MRKKLLVFEFHHLGDAVMSLPFVNAASETFDVTVCCRPALRQIHELALHRPRVVPLEPPWGDPAGTMGEARECARRFRGERFDAAVGVWADSRVHLLMKLSGAPRRIGFPMTSRNYYGINVRWRRRQLARGRALGLLGAMATGGRLLTDRLERRDYHQHHLDDWGQIAEALGLNWNPAPPWLEAPAAPESPELERFLAAAGREKIWLLHPGGRLPTKRWPAERFEAVIERTFAPRNVPLIVVEPPGEPIPNLSGGRTLSVKCADVAELAGLIARVDAVLCNDSLAAHLAAALGRRVLTIFGSGEPRWFAPHADEERVIQRDVCPHHPCIDRCVMPSVVCLEAVAVEQVCAAVEAEMAG